MRHLVLASLLSLGSIAAQTTADHVVVISRTTSPALTALFDVDLATGAVQPLDRFSLDRFPPLAVAVDHVNRDVVAALQTPIGSSVLVRLRTWGTRIVGSQSLGDVPGIVTALAQALDGSWITTSDAGVHVTERNGSVPRTIATFSHASAIETFGLGSTQAVVARSGSAGNDPDVRWLDLTTGQTIAGPWVYAGHLPRGITGVADLPTGLSRQVISQEDGTIALSLNFANPTVLPLQPALPSGGTVAMHVRGLEGVVLGGSAHPFLKSFQALSATQWTLLAGPLPGDPVDFAFRPAVEAATVPFGGTCATMQLLEAPAGGPPRLGNMGYGVELARGQPQSPVFLLLGVSAERFLSLRLPATLPGGCRALASGEAVALRTTDGSGRTSVTVPIPAKPALLGAIAFGQWLQMRGAAIDSSNAGAIWIGN